MAQTITEVYRQLRPFIQRQINETRGGGGNVGISSPSEAGHIHDDLYYTEAESNSRFVNAAGDTLTGDLLVSSGVTVDGVDISAHAANVNAHHNQSHVLATNTALGGDHTISGATSGHVLRASSATAAAFSQLAHSDLGSVTANQHHNQSHVLATTTALGADHTVSGLTAGQVLKATSATAAKFIQLLHSELGGLTVDDHGAIYPGFAQTESITGAWTFAPASPGAPFALNANGQGQTVTGLKADQLNKSVIAGAGLINGGALTGDVTLDVGAGTLITVGADTVGITAGANYQYIGTGAGTAASWINLSTLAGAGLTHSAGVLAVGAGAGITVNADDVALTTPGTLTASTSNSSTGSHTHAITTGAASTLSVSTSNGAGSSASLARADHLHTITSSSNPGAAASLLASDGTGMLTLPIFTATTRVRTSTIDSATGTALTLSPAQNLILNPGTSITSMAANAAIQASSYASQTTGWRITDPGEADFRYLFVDEMHAKSFIADLEQALAGGQIISKSVAMVGADFTLPTAGNTGTLWVRDLPSAPNMAVFQAGDFVGLRQFSRSAGSLTIGWAWGTVATYVDGSGGNEGLQSWQFTRHAGTPGSATGTIYKDAIVLDFGTTGNGFYEVNAIDGTYGANSPYAQVVTWASHPATQTVRARFGHLKGIFNVTDEFGLYGGTGTSVTSRYIRASSTAVELRNVPLALYDGTNNTVLLSAGGSNNSPFFALGTTLPTGSVVGNGIWMGLESSVYKFRVGTVSASLLTAGILWDGSVLTWKAANTSLDSSGNLTATSATLSGSITASTGAIGGWSIGATTLAATNITLTSGAANTAHILAGTGSTAGGVNSANASGDIVFWAGSTHANRATAFYRVTAGGALTATSGAIGGWTLAATSLTSGSGATTVGVDSGGTNPAFYAGNATPGSAPFRVTNAGALTADNATITGSITASSGSITGKLTVSGASGAFALGTTPPTSASAGTGLWLDRTGLYGLLTNTVQAKLDAATGAITAGGGKHILNSSGYTIDASGGQASSAWITWKDGATTVMKVGAYKDLGAYFPTIETVQNFLYLSAAVSVEMGPDANVSGTITAANGVITSILTLSNSGLHVLDTDASHDLIIKPGSNLTADRILTITTGDAARTLTINGNPTLNDWFDQGVKVAATPTFAGVISSSTVRPLVDVASNLGSATYRWGTLYVDQIIATTVSGTTMSGAEWEYTGSMVIDANSASTTTVSITNQGAGVANLVVEGSATAASFSTVGSITGASLSLSGSMTAGTVPWARLSGHPSVTAGNGLTGGGALSGSVTLTVGAGTMITVGTTTVGITTGANYQFIGTGAGTAAAWQNLSTLAGNGLSHSAGVLTVGAGTLITVASTTVGLSVGTAQYQMITTGATPFTPAYTAMSTLAGNGLSFASGALAVGAGTLITVSSTTVGLSNGTAQYQVPVTGATPFTPAWTALSTYAGAGMSWASNTYAVGAGTLITVGATTVGITAAGGTYQFIGSAAGTAASWVAMSTLAGAGLTHTSGVLSLTTPGSLSATSTNSSSGSHTHAIDTTIARAAITITAGAGLTGGGDLSANRTLDVGAGTMITVAADTVGISTGAAYQFIGTGAGTAAGWINMSTLAGNGLSHSAGVLTVGAGTLITVSSTTVGLSNGTAQYQVPVTGATPFTPAWTALSTYAGAGMSWASNTYAVGAGTLITVAADTVGITAGATYQFIGTGAGTAASWINMSTLAGNGLSHSAGVLTVGAGTLITVASTTVGITAASANYQFVGSGAGTAAAWQNLSTLAGNGLSHSAGVLTVGAGTMITVGATTVGISTGSTWQYIGTGSGTTAAWNNLSGLAGNGMTWTSNTFTLGTPSTLTVSTTNAVTASAHTHAVTSSSNPGAAASLLATTAAGLLTLVALDVDTISDRSGSNLTLSPAGDLILDPIGNDVLPNNNYDISLGSLSKKYLTLHAAELWVETLVAQETIATIGGRILVGQTTTLTNDLSNVATSMVVKHNNLRNGDVVYMEAGGQLEFMAITSNPTGTGPYTYTVTRNLDGTGAGTWYAGDAVFNTGTTGNGFIDLYSLWSINGRNLSYIYNWSGAAYSVNYADSASWSIFGDGANNAVNDAVYFGLTGTTWNNLFFNVVTAGVYSATIAWEYWNGAAWTGFTPTVSVGTAAAPFKNAGAYSVTWTTLAGWAATSVNSLSAFWVRARISAFTSWTTLTVQGDKKVRAVEKQYGPSIVGNIRNSTTWNDFTERWAVGNLDGLYDYGVDTYGAAFGNPAATWLSMDDTNGIRITNGSTQVGRWDTSGNITVGIVAASKSNILISTAGTIDFRTDTVSDAQWDTAGGIRLGRLANEHLLLTTTSLQFKNNTSVDVDLTSAGTLTLGRTAALRTVITTSSVLVGDSGGENIYVDANGVYLRSSSTVYTSLAGTTLTLGLSSAEHVLVNTSGVALRDNTTVYGVFAATTTVGSTSTEHVSITSSGLQIKDGATVYTDVAAGVISVGNTAAEHVLINTSGVSLKDAATVYALFAATTTIGVTTTEHISISSASVQIKDGATVYTDLTAGALSLGNVAAENILINTSGVALRDVSTVYALFAATTTIGVTTTEHISISSTSVQIKDGSSVYTDLTAGALTLGLVSSGEYVSIDSTNGLRFYNAGTVSGHWKANGDLVIGDVANSKDRIEITSGAINLINRSAGAVDSTVLSISNAGVITVGAVGASLSNALLSSGGLQLRNNTTVKVDLQSDGDFFIGTNTAAAATTAFAIFSNAQTYNSFAVDVGDILIGDNTAGKSNIWWDKSAGTLNFRGGNTTQAYVDTTGALAAGAGSVLLDANGITISYGGASGAHLLIKDGSTKTFDLYGATESSQYNTYLKFYPQSDITGGNFIIMSHNAAGSETGRVSFQDDGGVNYMGSGSVIFNKSVTVHNSYNLTLGNSGLRLQDTDASHSLIITPGSNLTANRILTLTTGDAARTLTINGNATLNDWFDQSVKTTAGPTFATLTVAGLIDIPTGGSASAPVVSFTGDSNTGFYRNAADEWVASANGQVVASFNGSTGSGRLGVAKISPAYTLDVNGSVAISSNLYLTGALVSSGYTTYTYVPLAAPLTSTAWDGDAYSTVGTSTLIDLSAVFGAPAGIKAINATIYARDSAAWGSGRYKFEIGPSSTYYYNGSVSCFGGDLYTEQSVVCNCDANGDIYYRITASGAGTMDLFIYIWGYWV